MAVALLLTQLTTAPSASANEAKRPQCEKAYAHIPDKKERERRIKRCVGTSAPLPVNKQGKPEKAPFKHIACRMRAEEEHLTGEAARQFIGNCMKS
ncbi:MAG: hypothetical protein KDE31_01395 [Caldilineaceae bacterium]|nr:hypothetical protein [Caldilineaceae bacterium]